MEFINISISENVSPSGVLQVGKTNRRRIRKQVMKDHFRRKEQQRKVAKTQGALVSNGTLVPQIPPSVGTPTVWRMSFIYKMTEGWFPQEYHPAAMENFAHSFESLRSAPVRAVQDALSMLHVGSVSKNDQVLVGARQRYALAVNSLRLVITGKSTEMQVSQTMMVATTIVMSEAYFAVSYGSQQITWQKHIAGMSALAQKCQSDTRNPGIETFLLSQLRIAQMIQSLCDRQPFPEDLAVREASTQSAKLESLLTLGSQLPSILKQVDACIDNQPRRVASSLVTNPMNQKRALTAYLTTHGMADSQDNWIQHDPVKGGVDRVLTSKSAFDLSCESLCRICLLLVVESLSNLESHMWPTQPPSIVPHPHAASLRKTVAFVTEASYTPICKARVMSAPLHFLRRFYEQQGDLAGLQWCQQVREAICEKAPWLRWDALLPWCMLYPHQVYFEAESVDTSDNH